MNFSSHCASRIKEERLKLGLSQEQVAEKTKVSREMWGRYERGAAIPGGEVLFSFAVIGADAQYILTGKPSDSSLSSLNTRTAVIAEKFEQLSDDDQQCLERVVEALVAAKSK